MRRYQIALALVTLASPTAGADEPSPASAPTNSEPKQTQRRNDTAIWIGLGATLIGCAVAIGSTIVAAKSKKPAKDSPD